MSVFDFESHIPEMHVFAKIWEYMASPTFRRALLEEIGDRAVSLVEDEFIRSQDPYGNKWAAHTLPRTKGGVLKRPRTITTSRILYKSGALAKTIKYKITNETIHLFSPMKYSQFHQTGTKHVPQRLIFPESLLGLPDSWRSAFDQAASLAFRRLLTLSAFR